MSLMDRWWKLGGMFGIGFLVLFIVGIIIPGNTPMPNDSAADIKQFYIDNGDAYMIGDLLTGIAFVFFLLPFASALRSFLGRAEGSDAVWSRLVYSGALLLVAIGAAQAGLNGSLAYSSAAFADDSLLKAFTDVSYYVFTLAFPFTAGLMILSTSLVILRRGVLWRWLGWFGLLETAIAVIGAFAILSDDPDGGIAIFGFISFIGLGIWMLATSICLWRQDAPPAVAT